MCKSGDYLRDRKCTPGRRSETAIMSDRSVIPNENVPSGPQKIIRTKRHYIDASAVFSKIASNQIAMQSDCIARGLNDDLAAVKNIVCGEKSAKSPVPSYLWLYMRNGD